MNKINTILFASFITFLRFICIATFASCFFTIDSQAQELAEESIEIETISLGTLNAARGGIDLFVEISTVDENHHMNGSFEAKIVYPDGAEGVARYPFGIRESEVNYYWGHLILETDLDDPGEYRLQPGEYHIELAVEAEEGDLFLHNRATFVYPEEEINNRLDRVDPEQVEFHHEDGTASVEWEAVEGAESYLVLMSDGGDTRRAVTGENRITFDGITNPQRMLITAYSAPLNQDYEGDYTAPPVTVQENEVVHRSSQLINL